MIEEFIIRLTLFVIGIAIGFIVGAGIMREEEVDKPIKMKLEDIPEEEFLAIAMAFGAEMERRMELHERGEIQEEEKPFEEYNGKE